MNITHFVAIAIAGNLATAAAALPAGSDTQAGASAESDTTRCRVMRVGPMHRGPILDRVSFCDAGGADETLVAEASCRKRSFGPRQSLVQLPVDCTESGGRIRTASAEQSAPAAAAR